MSPDTWRALRTATWRTVLRLGALVAYVVLLGLLTRPAHGQQRPTAVFNATCTGLTCQFSGQGSTWPNGHVNTDRRVWDFGDGTSRGGPPYGTIVTATYAAAGTYQVRYTITDQLGLSDDTVRTIAVGIVAPHPNQPPVARFSSTCTGLTCRFDGALSSDDVGIVTSSWRLGDGTATAGVAVTHTYARPGTWAVELSVTDATGAVGVARQAVTVQVPPPPGFASPRGRMDVRQGLGRALLAYRWFFGDSTRVMTQATLVDLTCRLTGTCLTAQRLSEIERAVGRAADTVEVLSLAMTISLLATQRADTALTSRVLGLWAAAVAERRRRGLP